MTTTAEKINFALRQLERGSKNKSDYAEKILEFFGFGQEHRFSVFAYVHKEMDLPSYIKEHWNERTKPPDPEPLECWIEAFSPDGGKYFGSKDAAMASKHHNRLVVPVHMREVTLQDKKDKKDKEDARRYRQAKLIVKAGSIKTKTGAYLLGSCTKDWDETIDKAMESE